MFSRSPEIKRLVDEGIRGCWEEGIHLADKHPRNQGVYWAYVQPKFYNSQKLISRKYCAKYHWFYRFIGYGTFAFHITQSDIQTRSVIMKNLFLNKTEDKSIEWVKLKLMSHKSGILKLL